MQMSFSFCTFFESRFWEQKNRKIAEHSVGERRPIVGVGVAWRRGKHTLEVGVHKNIEGCLLYKTVEAGAT